MRNLKKFLALVLAMMMAFSLLATANAQNPNYDYPDIEDATFTEAIDVLTGMGVFRGDNGEFKPDRTIMRSEAVAVLYRLVTGDVTDSQAQLYAPAAAYFTDVPANAWYAGYVGFAVDAGFVKGFNGEFNPNGKVTGYEMLAMLLRAVGYGKNGEFTGSQWMVNVGATAQSLGILKTIESTDFANTLAKASPREVVAELTFQTAAYIPTVRYEYGYYNQYQGVAIATGGNIKNPTLGAKVFGLTSESGIVLGNQETGENKTIVGTAYDYDYTNTDYQISVDTKTTLALYGHAVTVWYRNSSAATKHGYAVIDEATSAMVYATDMDPAAALGAAAEAEGFNTLRNAATIQYSAEYGRFDSSAITSPSAINMYTVIDNTGNGGIDAVIRLNAEVAQIVETKTTAKPQTLTLGGKTASSFGASGVITASGNGNKILPNSTTKLGEIVTAWQVAGTKVAASDTTDAGAAYYRLSSPLKTVTGTVSTYTVADDSKVGSVKLATGETIKRSGILTGEQDIAYYVGKGVDPTDISAGVTYTFVVDDLGRFLDISAPTEFSFLYGTYADFQYGTMGSGEIDYKVYGINWAGEKVNDHALTWMNLDGSKYGPGAGTLGTLGEGYKSANLKITKKDMATNSVIKGSNMAVMISEKGQMILGATDGSAQLTDGDNLIQWPVTNKDAANGFAKVQNGDGTDYMLTNDTLFYVVTGFGTGATVQTYKGLKELVGSGTSVTISYAANKNNGPTDQVWFEVDDYKFDSITTTSNNSISKMILSASNLEGYSAQNLYYNSDATATGVQLAGLAGINQYKLWLNGEEGTYFLNTTDGATPEANKFYTLSKDSEWNGVTIYQARLVGSAAGDDPKQAVPGNGGVCNVDQTYTYVMVNNYNKAQIGSDILNVDGAVVADVQFADAAAAGTPITNRVEIDSVLKLNNAVSTGYTVTVAIVNDGINVATIYVTSVTAS